MSDPIVDKIQHHPKYHELQSKRNNFGWLLCILMFIVYYGYIGLIAFNKPFLGQPIGEGGYKSGYSNRDGGHLIHNFDNRDIR